MKVHVEFVISAEVEMTGSVNEIVSLAKAAFASAHPELTILSEGRCYLQGEGEIIPLIESEFSSLIPTAEGPSGSSG